MPAAGPADVQLMVRSSRRMLSNVAVLAICRMRKEAYLAVLASSLRAYPSSMRFVRCGNVARPARKKLYLL
jgi:hypothetical protein